MVCDVRLCCCCHYHILVVLGSLQTKNHRSASCRQQKNEYSRSLHSHWNICDALSFTIGNASSTTHFDHKRCNQAKRNRSDVFPVDAASQNHYGRRCIGLCFHCNLRWSDNNKSYAKASVKINQNATKLKQPGEVSRPYNASKRSC